MYYVLVILSVAASAAFSNLVGEVGSEYFANYLVDNEPNDLGVKAPARDAASPDAAGAAAPVPAATPAAGKPDLPAVATITPEAKAILDLARDTPYRKPDGSAFLPIATQRIFSMRWLVSHQADVPIAFEIPGHVITN